MFRRNPDSMFIEQCSAAERHPDIEHFQFVLQTAGQSRARSPLRFHPFHQRIRKQFCFNSVFFAFEKLAMEPRGCVKSAHGIGPMMETRTAERAVFDDHNFETLLCCKDRRLAASRPSTYDRNLIIFIHIPAQTYLPLETTHYFV